MTSKEKEIVVVEKKTAKETSCEKLNFIFRFFVRFVVIVGLEIIMYVGYAHLPWHHMNVEREFRYLGAAICSGITILVCILFYATVLDKHVMAADKKKS